MGAGLSFLSDRYTAAMRLPVSRRDVAVGIITTTRGGGRRRFATCAGQFGGGQARAFFVPDGAEITAAVFYRTHFRAMSAMAREDLVLMCCDTCLLTEPLARLTRRLDRYVCVLDRETRGAWCMVNLSPMCVVPLLWQTTMQTDLFYAAPHGARCVLFNMNQMRPRLEAAGEARWRQPLYVDAWLGLPFAARFAVWPPVAYGPDDDVALVEDLITVTLGVVVPTLVCAALLLASVRKRKRETVDVHRR